VSATGAPRRLEGVVCVVTGAARGIGLSIVERYASEGARVASLDVSAKRLEPVVAELVARGLNVRGYACDVASRLDVARVFAQVESDFGAPIGVLVNNAMWTRFQPLDQIDEETAERTYSVGLKALIWSLQAVAPQMKRRGGGSVINLSSTGAVRSVTHSMVYASLKAAVLGFTRAAAVEMSQHGIRVNAIMPGMIATPAAIGNYDAATLAQRAANVPLRRFGESDEVASVAAFLASDESRYMQGSEVVVDGGWSIAAQ